MRCVITGEIQSLNMDQTGLIINGNIKVSDSFHDIDELYSHRIILFCSLCKCNKNISWKSKLHFDKTSLPGWFIAGMKLPEGMITYHIPENLWEIFDGIEELETAPEWDGHSSSDVIKRLFSFSKGL